MKFIKLEEPYLTDIPSEEESKRFENYMRENVALHGKSGAVFNGCRYFENKEENDIAYIIENELIDWSYEHHSVYYDGIYVCITDIMGNIVSRVYDVNGALEDLFFTWEYELTQKINKLVGEHIKRTGKIGHFPFSEKRILLSYRQSNGVRCSVVFDPENLGPDNIDQLSLEKSAAANDFEKKAADKLKRQKIAEREMKTRFTVFVVSAVAFIIICLLTAIVNKSSDGSSLGLSLIAAGIIPISIPAAVISLAGYFRSRTALENIRKENVDKLKIIDVEEYEFQLYRIGTHNTVHKYYTRDVLRREVRELYKYFRFRQLWAERAGLENPWPETIDDFIKKMEQFIINSDDFKK